jgi:hypothetical protein
MPTGRQNQRRIQNFPEVQHLRIVLIFKELNQAVEAADLIGTLDARSGNGI